MTPEDYEATHEVARAGRGTLGCALAVVVLVCAVALITAVTYLAGVGLYTLLTGGPT